MLKMFSVLVLGALASGTGVWAARESAALAERGCLAEASECCGFCVPGEPCEACLLGQNAKTDGAEFQVVSLTQEKPKGSGPCCAGQALDSKTAEASDCCGFCVPGEPCEACLPLPAGD